ncbi:MAG: type II toxin-antitoxin system VapC family toxin [Spirochaetaceae bacterium]|nr:type II toxin-antitoxin system VapC family toxin [Spirochaetaceae bacterium]
MVAYLDSSVLLRHILLGEEPIRHALGFPRVVSSELLEIECRRVLHRCRLAGELTDEALTVARERLDEVLAGIDLLEMSRQIKQRAMDPFPVNVRTLDALHVATALLVGEDAGGVALFSHDEGMNRCARSLGINAALR